MNVSEGWWTVLATPAEPKIYHITHVDNLRQIVADGGLLSDAAMSERGGPEAAIGMHTIKRRRREELRVPCHPDTKVGDFVPFYFCPRSVMLYVIYCQNHADLAYRGGQGPILHLEADLRETIAWANENRVRWAFSLSNAGAWYTSFRSEVAHLDEVDWGAVENPDFRAPETKEGKSAEFLVYGGFPLDLVKQIGVLSHEVGDRAADAVADSPHDPAVTVRPDWYF
jgi:hypothetical protein